MQTEIASYPTIDRRRYDLDWVRVGAFALLILYHVGMFYVTWDWHVKSDHASRLIEPAMGILNPWRLALLFFISGVAIRFASEKQGMGQFGLDKLRRLLPPIVVGMLLIVPPQTYFELRFKEDIPAEAWGFYLNYLDFNQVYPMITPTWNHLWYVVYILIYSLFLMPLLPLLRRLATAAEPFIGRVARGSALWVVILPMLPFLFYQLVLVPRFPTTHALFDDWANHANSFTLLLFGYLVAKSDGFWKAVDKALPLAASIAIGLAVVLFVERAARYGMPISVDRAEIVGLVRVVYAWVAILTILGFAQRYLNRKSRVLAYLSEAVFPYYILHQTVIVLIAYPMIGAGVPVLLEAVIILAVTFGGCLLLHELVIRRSRLLRPLFGLRPIAVWVDGAPPVVRARRVRHGFPVRMREGFGPMSNIKTSYIPLVACGALLALAAFTGWGGVAFSAASKPDERTFQLEGDRLVIVKDSGIFDIRPADVDKVEVTRWFSGRSWIGGRAEATWNLAGDTLTLTTSCGIIGQCDVRYAVLVPRAVALTVTGENGAIFASGFERELTVNSQNGTVSIEDTSGDLTMNSHNGELRATDIVSGRVEASSQNGRVHLTFAAVPDQVDVTTENGAVTVVVPDAKYNVSTITDNGNVRVDVPRDANSAHSINVQTDNGAITLRTLQ